MRLKNWSSAASVPLGPNSKHAGTYSHATKFNYTTSNWQTFFTAIKNFILSQLQMVKILCYS